VTIHLGPHRLQLVGEDAVDGQALLQDSLDPLVELVARPVGGELGLGQGRKPLHPFRVAHSCERPTRSSPKPRAQTISVLEAMSEAMPCTHLAAPSPRDQTCVPRPARCLTAESTFGRDVSLVRAPCPGRRAKTRAPSIVRMCDYCRAVVARGSSVSSYPASGDAGKHGLAALGVDRARVARCRFRLLATPGGVRGPRRPFGTIGAQRSARAPLTQGTRSRASIQSNFPR
jgi:hypothetical protein